jgi:hypothetical protein
MGAARCGDEVMRFFYVLLMLGFDRGFSGQGTGEF